MKQIFLLRHAKSDWDNLNQQDFDRPLAKRGIKEADLLSKHIKEKHYLIDKFYVAPQEEPSKHTISFSWS